MVKLLVLTLTTLSFLYPQETKGQNDQKAPSSETKKPEKPNNKTIEEILKNTTEKVGLLICIKIQQVGKPICL